MQKPRLPLGHSHYTESINIHGNYSSVHANLDSTDVGLSGEPLQSKTKKADGTDAVLLSAIYHLLLSQILLKHRFSPQVHWHNCALCTVHSKTCILQLDKVNKPEQVSY